MEYEVQILEKWVVCKQCGDEVNCYLHQRVGVILAEKMFDMDWKG